ncbi:MAG: efflux RND transporter periplasmic adaptor subunit [Gemmatimonadota bacterium]
MQDQDITTTPRRFKYIALAGVTLVLAVGAFAVQSRGTPSELQAAQRTEAAIEVVVRRVQQLSRPTYIAVSGEMEGQRTVNIGFKVAGVVERVVPEEGDFVRAGDVIAELEADSYELGLQMATAGADRARDAFTRAKKMFDEGSLPAADFVQVETGVRQAIAQESLARKQVTDTKLKSPISGRLARRGIQPGEQVGPGMPVFTVIAVDPVEARVGVPEAEIGRVRVGQTASISIPSLGGGNYQGRVRVVGVAADPVSRSYTVRIAVPNPSGILRPGMIAEVRINDGKQIQALTLPGEAIVRNNEGNPLVYVFEPKENRVHARRVEVGSVFGREVEIRSGLTGGEMVVVGGQSRLRTGASVKARVLPAGSTPEVGS